MKKENLLNYLQNRTKGRFRLLCRRIGTRAYRQVYIWSNNHQDIWVWICNHKGELADGAQVEKRINRSNLFGANEYEVIKEID